MRAKNLNRARTLLSEALHLCQDINDFHMQDVKKHLFKAIEGIDARTKNKKKIQETVNPMVAKQASYAKQPKANTAQPATADTFKIIQNMIKEQEKKLIELELNKLKPTTNSLIND